MLYLLLKPVNGLVCFMCPRADKKNQTKVACMDSGVWMQKKAEAQ